MILRYWLLLVWTVYASTLRGWWVRCRWLRGGRVWLRGRRAHRGRSWRRARRLWTRWGLRWPTPASFGGFIIQGESEIIIIQPCNNHATGHTRSKHKKTQQKHAHKEAVKRIPDSKQKQAQIWHPYLCLSLLFQAATAQSTYSDSYSAHIKYVIKEAEASSAGMERHPRQQPRRTNEQHRDQSLSWHSIKIALLSGFLTAGVQKNKSQAQHPQFYWQSRHWVADQEGNRAGWRCAEGMREEDEGEDEGTVGETVADPTVGGHQAEGWGHQGSRQWDRTSQEEW